MLPVPSHSPISIRLIRLAGPVIVLNAAGTAGAGRCPGYGKYSDQVHARYQRRPLDLPWRGHTVRLALTVRRFRCGNPDCARGTFAEDFGPLLPRLARQTADTTAWFLQLAVAAGGEVGARLAKQSGVLVSPDTLLRILRQTPEPAPPNASRARHR